MIRKLISCFAFISLVLVSAGSNAAGADLQNKRDAEAMEKWAYSLGVQAYVFGLPLTIFEREYALRLDAAKIERMRSRCPCEMVNGLGHKLDLASDKDVMPYTPNNDTVYSGALLDLSDEPVILSMPDIEDRYWSVQVANAYTENEFYLGTRATEGKGGHHAFIGPNWNGELPDGVIPHRMDYDAGLFAVRIAVVPQDAADLKRLNTLQKQFVMTSLSNFKAGRMGESPVPASATATPRGDGELAYFEQLAALLGKYPPQAKHQAMLNSFAMIGLIPGKPFNAKALPAPVRAGLVRALTDAPAIMKWKVKYRGTPRAGKWNNLRAGDYGYDYLDRAAGALEGLLVHNREEAVYFSTYESGDGEFLDSNAQYVLHFDKDELPPVDENGFWSLTMYGPDFQLVENAIDRFSIGSRTPGLKFNEDGSLDIYVQNTPPEGKESNWLPSPKAGLLDRLFRINYRIYLPRESARNPQTLDAYLPPITKTQ